MSQDITRRNYLRQLDIIDPNDIPPITIIGCGASGSWVGVIGAKMGVQNITLWDGDEVDYHNIPNQLFMGNMLERNKADALREEIVRFTPEEMKPIVISQEDFFEEGDRVYTPFVFLCVDGLSNTRMVFDVLEQNQSIKWIINTRMGGEYYEIHTVDMSNEEEKREFREGLSAEAREEGCSDRSVIYTAVMMVGRAVNFFKRISKGEKVPKMYAEDLGHPIVPPYKEWREGE